MSGRLLPLVFNRVGSRNPNTVIAQLAELTRRHRQGEAHDGFRMYDGKLPIVVTGSLPGSTPNGTGGCRAVRATLQRRTSLVW
ncbi:hypothetical protein [Streptomyces sp. NRRL S-1022]|uniref:hypothetical protein n=1 Tax=Streptomyces sp. NRRL S-1022 TaxID=1463880 RepID=UPI0004C29A19|nr:hypothetical protein [Streptomyces sp. NRRL S-1022]